ncbi:hypothetical protein N9W21_03475 [Shewanella sp.]|nr:hypothetical protein [Shewanella sp.]
MARLTKVHANLIANVLRKRIGKVSFSANWQKIFAELEVGDVDESSRALRFSAEQLHQLNQMSTVYFGSELLNDSFEGTRTEVAKHSRYEKLAAITPDEQYVLLKPHPFYAGLPLEYSLRIPLTHIIELLKSQATPITHLVIVENLDAFDCWQQFSVDESLNNALVVYRGHNGLAKGLSALLELLPQSIAVVAFVDVDPAGIQIALTTPKVTQLLAPSIEALLSLVVSASASEDYTAQYKQLKYIRQQNHAWQVLQQFIIEHQVSIKQQHLLAHQLRLMLHSKAC